MKVLPNERAAGSPRPAESQSHVPSSPPFLSPRHGVTPAPRGPAPLPTCGTVSKARGLCSQAAAAQPHLPQLGSLQFLFRPEHTPALSHGARSASQTCPLPIPGRSRPPQGLPTWLYGNGRGWTSPDPLADPLPSRAAPGSCLVLLHALWGYQDPS